MKFILLPLAFNVNLSSIRGVLSLHIFYWGNHDEPIMKLVSTVMQKGSATNEELAIFLRDTARAEFLFEGEMERHIDAIYTKAVHLHYVANQLDNRDLPDGPERTAFEQESKEDCQWLDHQYNQTDKMFIKYVKLDE